MVRQGRIEMIAGIFVLLAIVALIALAFKVSGLTGVVFEKGYYVTADFDNIGQLKVRAPVKIGGVRIGEVSRINLNPTTFSAVVTLHINANMQTVPEDSSASIMTAGLLGDNYIDIEPGYETKSLKNGGHIQVTHSAIVLEKLIGQLLFSIKKTGSKAASH